MLVITVARKPLAESTVAKNVLAHGCGGINVDASRISGNVQKGAGSTGFGSRDDKYIAGTGSQYSNEGRWPANFILSHLPGCVCAGTKKVKTSTPSIGENGKTAKYNTTGQVFGIYAPKVTTSHLDKDGKETIQAWDCQPGCPVAGLDDQSGCTQSPPNRLIRRGSTTGNTMGFGGNPGVQLAMIGNGDKGGASRFFKVIQ